MTSTLINHMACRVLLFIISLFCELATKEKEMKTEILYMVLIADENNRFIQSLICSLEEMERKTIFYAGHCFLTTHYHYFLSWKCYKLQNVAGSSVHRVIFCFSVHLHVPNFVIFKQILNPEVRWSCIDYHRCPLRSASLLHIMKQPQGICVIRNA